MGATKEDTKKEIKEEIMKGLSEIKDAAIKSLQTKDDEPQQHKDDGKKVVEKSKEKPADDDRKEKSQDENRDSDEVVKALMDHVNEAFSKRFDELKEMLTPKEEKVAEKKTGAQAALQEFLKSAGYDPDEYDLQISVSEKKKGQVDGQGETFEAKLRKHETPADSEDFDTAFKKLSDEEKAEVKRQLWKSFVGMGDGTVVADVSDDDED